MRKGFYISFYLFTIFFLLISDEQESDRNDIEICFIKLKWANGAIQHSVAWKSSTS